jgi:hypothetical protein
VGQDFHSRADIRAPTSWLVVSRKQRPRRLTNAPTRLLLCGASSRVTGRRRIWCLWAVCPSRSARPASVGARLLSRLVLAATPPPLGDLQRFAEASRKNARIGELGPLSLSRGAQVDRRDAPGALREHGAASSASEDVGPAMTTESAEEMALSSPNAAARRAKRARPQSEHEGAGQFAGRGEVVGQGLTSSPTAAD